MNVIPLNANFQMSYCCSMCLSDKVHLYETSKIRKMKASKARYEQETAIITRHAHVIPN